MQATMSPIGCLTTTTTIKMSQYIHKASRHNQTYSEPKTTDQPNSKFPTPKRHCHIICNNTGSLELSSAQSIRSKCSIKNFILTHQKYTLLFYHIILQYPIYQMFYHSILYIKIIYYLFLIITINNNNGTSTTAATTATNSNNIGQPPLAQTHIHQRHLKKKKKKTHTHTHTQPERSAQP